MPCLRVNGYLNKDTLMALLDRAGDERFRVKAVTFQKDLAHMGAGQALYRGIMGALGYAKNKIQCLELADRLPLQVLEAIAREEIPYDECLARQQALLLGTAGLLPSQSRDRHRGNGLDDRWTEKLEGLWSSSQCTGAMSPGTWHLFKVRPNNSPIRRLAAMSYLILRYRKEGILKGLLDTVSGASPGRGCHGLEKALVVTSGGDWARQLDSGSGSRKSGQTLLGSRRATDILVNVLLPFTAAWSKSTSQLELERNAVEIYRNYQKLAENAVERHMKNQLGLTNRLVNSARRQQGLIHIYNTFCIRGRCDNCPLGHVQS